MYPQPSAWTSGGCCALTNSNGNLRPFYTSECIRPNVKCASVISPPHHFFFACFSVCPPILSLFFFPVKDKLFGNKLMYWSTHTVDVVLRVVKRIPNRKNTWHSLNYDGKIEQKGHSGSWRGPSWKQMVACATAFLCWKAKCNDTWQQRTLNIILLVTWSAQHWHIQGRTVLRALVHLVWISFVKVLTSRNWQP